MLGCCEPGLELREWVSAWNHHSGPLPVVGASLGWVCSRALAKDQAGPQAWASPNNTGRSVPGHSFPCDAILHSRLQGTYVPLSLHRATGLSVQDPGWRCFYLSMEAPGLRTFGAQPSRGMDEPTDAHQLKLSRGKTPCLHCSSAGSLDPKSPAGGSAPPGPLQGSPERV